METLSSLEINSLPIPRFVVRLLVVLIAVGAKPMLAIAQASLVKTTVTYREVDGHQVLLDVLRPPNENTCPVIVWIHGGALIMGGREGIPPQIRSVAEEHACALVSIDYRLAPETKLPEIISDIEAAFQWIAGDGSRRFRLDPSRIIVAGGSAGGYLTLVTGYRVTPKPKALVALYGYGDLIGDWYSTPSPHARHNAKQVSLEEANRQTDGTVISNAKDRKGNGSLIYMHYRQRGIWPVQVSGFTRESIAERIVPYEPLRNVTASYPPTLLIHGNKDTDVPYEQSVMMAAQFERHGVAHSLITIENGEHGFGGGDPIKIEGAYRTMREFVSRYLK
ncbi:MAG: alpha/beta hydrolase [Pirellula sp.]